MASSQIREVFEAETGVISQTMIVAALLAACPPGAGVYRARARTSRGTCGRTGSQGRAGAAREGPGMHEKTALDVFRRARRRVGGASSFTKRVRAACRHLSREAFRAGRVRLDSRPSSVDTHTRGRRSKGAAPSSSPRKIGALRPDGSSTGRGWLATSSCLRVESKPRPPVCRKSQGGCPRSAVGLVRIRSVLKFGTRQGTGRTSPRRSLPDPG